MIRILVGDTHGPMGWYELDETDPAATMRMTALGGKKNGKTTASKMANIFLNMHGLRESDAETLRALPSRLHGYQWAKNVSPPVQGHAPKPELLKVYHR